MEIREGPEGDLWLAASELEDCEALDTWQAWKVENTKRLEESEQPRLTIQIPVAVTPRYVLESKGP
jgi:hypothetical protein